MRLTSACLIKVALIGLTAAGNAAVGNVASPKVSHASPVASTLTPAALSVVNRWRARVVAGTKRHAISKGSSKAKELSRRVAIEQMARMAIPDRASTKVSDSDWEAVNKAIWDQLTNIDAENTKYLKSILPADGWFRIRRDGMQVTSDAWLIVQHSPDRLFQHRVLDLMTPLLSTGDASGSKYALLYDRVAMFEGRRQRYGSQIVWSKGVFEPSPVENADQLDQLRASVGLEPMADYLRHWDGKSC